MVNIECEFIRSREKTQLLGYCTYSMYTEISGHCVCHTWLWGNTQVPCSFCLLTFLLGMKPDAKLVLEAGQVVTMSLQK